MVRLASLTMETGYHIHYYSGEKPFGNELPPALIPGKTLDADIDQIASAIRTWVNNKENRAFRTLSITLVGPVDGLTQEPRKTSEEILAASKDILERFYALGDAAKSRFDAGDCETAKAYTEELQKMTPSYRKNWNYGNAIASANIVLGRLALRDGNIQEAEAFLVEAGKSPGSPQMDSFGPNMSLAQDLLIGGHSAAVLEYFKLCEVFWAPEFSKLEQWTEDVSAGRIPDFGANLVY